MQAEQGFVLQAAYEAVEDAGITLQELHNTTTGIFVAGYCTFLVGPHTLTRMVQG
jgi:acyl transferase domain-containing protein